MQENLAPATHLDIAVLIASAQLTLDFEIFGSDDAESEGWALKLGGATLADGNEWIRW